MEKIGERGESPPKKESQEPKPRWFRPSSDVYGDPSPGQRSENWQGTVKDVVEQKELHPRISKTGKFLLFIDGVRVIEGMPYAYVPELGGWIRYPRQKRKSPSKQQKTSKRE